MVLVEFDNSFDCIDGVGAGTEGGSTRETASGAGLVSEFGPSLGRSASRSAFGPVGGKVERPDGILAFGAVGIVGAGTVGVGGGGATGAGAVLGTG